MAVAPFTDKQVREAMAALVVSAVGSGPKVYPYNCLNYKQMPDGKPDFGEWPGLFTYGTNGEFIHGWVIKRTSRHTEIREPGCEDLMWFYDLFGFFKFDPDVGAGPDYTSSDDTFSGIVEAVSNKFNLAPILVVNGYEVLHFGLQFPSLTVLRAGEQLLHFAGGQIELQYQS